MGADGRRIEVTAGQGVFFERGEHHSKGSDSGMTVLMVQVTDLQLSPTSQRGEQPMTPNPAFDRTAASALRLLAAPSSLRSSAAAQRERWASQARISQ